MRLASFRTLILAVQRGTGQDVYIRARLFKAEVNVPFSATLQFVTKARFAGFSESDCGAALRRFGLQEKGPTANQGKLGES